MASVFIDGEAGTTGLEIRSLLRAEPVDVHAVPDSHRKDPAARQAIMAAVDLVVLCLPDEASREAVALADALGPDAPRLLDASTAFRCDPTWAYGFPELNLGQTDRIAYAARVANPGCYATGAIALLRPLVDAGLLPPDFGVAIHAVSGYSGGGRAMIEAHQKNHGPAFELYALGLEHKHVAEMQLHSGLIRRPIFTPSVGHFRQGMLVSIPLHLDDFPGRPAGADLAAALAERYRGAARIAVLASPEDGRLEPEGLNGTDRMELFVIANETRRQAVLVARLDNLGKGAAGAAVQNLRLMLGFS